MKLRDSTATPAHSALERIHPRSLKSLHTHLQALVAGRLWLKVLLAMFVGFAVGVLIGPSVGVVPPEIASVLGEWCALPGEVFLALVRMIVIPLVFASIIRGLAASEDLNQLRRLGSRTLAYILATTVLAIVIGIGMATLIQPGRFMDAPGMRRMVEEVRVEAADTVADEAPAAPATIDAGELPERLVSLLPVNPLGAMTEGEMLQVIVFAAILGMALITMPVEQSKPLLNLLGSLQIACMVIVKWAMWLAPLAVFGFMARLASQVGLQALAGLSVYVATVLGGLLMLVLVYFIVLFVVARTGPLPFMRSVREVVLLAFSTSSSAAVMPLSIKTAEEKLGVRPSISQFVIPLAATINMNGTALYQGVATIFLAQAFGIDLSAGTIVLVIVTAVGASIGSPAMPGVGIVILSMIVTNAGIPAGGIALIMGVDRILDMSRTAVNVTGDLVTVMVMDRWIGGDRSSKDMLAEQHEREVMRDLTGEDVLIEPSSPAGEVAPQGAPEAVAATAGAGSSATTHTGLKPPSDSGDATGESGGGMRL